MSSDPLAHLAIPGLIARARRLSGRLASFLPAIIGALLAAQLAGGASAAVAGGGEGASPSGFYTREQALRGKALYAEHCSRCHLEDLAGGGPILPLAGDGFMSRWQNQSVYDLYVRVRITMPQDRPGTLNDRIVVDIVAFLLRANGLPAGSTEIGPDEGALKLLVIGVPQ